MAFPLFQLPILVIKLVLETMRLLDLFVLTSSSSRTKRIVKNLVTIRNHNMRIFMTSEAFMFDFRPNSDPSFEERSYFLFGKFHQPKDAFYLKIGSNDRISSKFVKATDGTAVLRIYWNKTFLISTQLYSTIFEVFKLPLKVVQMDFEGVETCRNWINWNNTTLHDASIVEIMGKCDFRTYTCILKYIRTENELAIRVEPTEYPSVDPEDPEIIENLNVERTKLLIKHGRWITMQQLKAIKASDISLNKVSFTDFQINSILRDLRDSEEVTNLKRLKICFNRVANPETVLEGIDVTEDLMTPVDAMNQWSFEMASGRKCTVIYAEYESDVQEFGFEFRVGI
ncbi:hypothetical protein CAEBREN_02919 [Caenorhabditis brenneri]|uniref:F-box domain-containing protein n=1 Tax=Caenorhabditis brenneri TaxID=135651 RepID=G0PB20_CAEBE|nr:hypothetical protein CAEBREN_02919 [Caenorhabditis brenneri]